MSRLIRSYMLFILAGVVLSGALVTDARASFLSTSIQRFIHPDAATQEALRTCYQTGTCTASPASTIDLYPLPCDGSGGKACAGCYTWRPGGYARIGALSAPPTPGGNPCLQHLGIDLAIYAGYQVQCPNSASSCTNGKLLLTCSYQEINSDTNAVVGLRECNGGNPILVDPTNSPTVIEPNTSCPANQQPDGTGNCVACPAGTYSEAGSNCQSCAFSLSLMNTSPVGTQSDGSIRLTINPTVPFPPYQLTASGGMITPTATTKATPPYLENYTGLSAAATTGTVYQFSVTDAVGCVRNASTTLMRSSGNCGLSLNTSSNNPSTAGANDGQIIATYSGETGTVTAFDISPPAATAPNSLAGSTGTFSNLGQNTYTLRVVDSACTATTKVTLTDPAPVPSPSPAPSPTPGCALTYTASVVTPPSTSTSADGSFKIDVGGTAGKTTEFKIIKNGANLPGYYPYLSSATLTTVTLTGMTAGNYQWVVQATDSACSVGSPADNTLTLSAPSPCPDVTCASGTRQIFRYSQELSAYQAFCNDNGCTVGPASTPTCSSPAKPTGYQSACSMGTQPVSVPLDGTPMQICNDTSTSPNFTFWADGTKACTY